MPIPYPVDYFDSVLKCEVEDLTDSIQGRYLLKVSLRNRCSRTMTIAMMNPSKANELESDDTINKMISFVYEQNLIRNSLVRDVKYINIVNVFPAYEPSSKVLEEKIKKIIEDGKLSIMQERNERAFSDAFSNSQVIVLAWGDVPKKVKAQHHNHEALMACDLIKKLGLERSTFVLKYAEFERVLTNKKRPRHPSWNTPIEYVKVRGLRTSRKFLYLDVD